MKNILLTFLLSFTFYNASAQCGVSTMCVGNNGLYSGDDPASIAYDNMGSSFHSSYIKEINGVWKVWGQRMAVDGTGHNLSPVEFNATNYPALTGDIYKMALGSSSGTVQLLVLTSTGLFALGIEGAVIDAGITNSTTFQKITIDGKADGLPVGVTPADVRMLFTSYQEVIITTCTGSVYALAASSNVRGNGGSGTSSQWSRVMQNATQPLTDVIVARGAKNLGYALKSDGTLWTWGDGAILGNGTAASNLSYATQMALPAGLPAIKAIQATSRLTTTPQNSYYILGTDKKVYSLGTNTHGQLGDQTATERLAWVNAKNPDDSIITDAAWISANEHDQFFAGFGVIKTGGVFYTAGTNNQFMIGRTINHGVNFLDVPTGITASDVILHAETGGHTCALIKLGSPRYGYVGHQVDGSMGNSTPADNTVPSYDFITPPAIAVCGTNCATPIITANSICSGQNANFTLSGSAGDTVTYTINTGNTQTAVIGPNGSVTITVTAATTDQTIHLTLIEGASGSCSTVISVSATIVVHPNNMFPTFNQVAPICSGDPLLALPTTSLEGIPGTWSPALNNTQTTTYTFSPVVNTCAAMVQMTITVNPFVTPDFSTVNNLICYGDTTFSLPTVSDNNVSGSWQPALNTTATTTYTFTPNTGQCANSTTLQVQVTDSFTFDYKAYCKDDNFMLEVLPSAAVDLNTASVEWFYNNILVGNTAFFDVSAYLNATIVTETAPYTFTVTVTDNGCAKSETIVLNTIYCGIQKGISVNNDNLNDFFDLRSFDVRKLSIFNRYGDKVFAMDNYENEWYGQSDSGNSLPTGAYYYLIDFENETSKTGWIYLSREN